MGKEADRKRPGDQRSAQVGRAAWFAEALRPWYQEHKRPLPWRATADPYRIWLSEVILQQTRVDQGRAYWERFVAKWPTVRHLARASEAEVLKMWQGLGYYSRARNLLAAARQVMDHFGGAFPPTHAELVRLKGVGDYTASAIASICFAQPDAVVDGNVYRVLARAFGIDTPIDSTRGRKQFKALAQELLDPQHPGDHNQAVMELGATVCTPKNYACLLCPLQAKCVAFAIGRIEELPVKEGVVRTRDRYFNYLHIRTSKGLYLRQRKGKDIWQGLWELPMLESPEAATKRSLTALLHERGLKGFSLKERSGEVRHVLSHQVIHATFWEVVPPKGFRPAKEWVIASDKDLRTYAVPRLIERWLEERGSH